MEVHHMIPTVTLRATYTCWWWPSDEPDTDHWTWGGWCDPRNPWGTADDEPRETYDVEGDEPIELVLPIYEAAEFIRDFPGAVWDWHDDCDASQNYVNGAYTTVTLHVSGEGEVAALNIAATLQAQRDHERRMRC
jgi:hypothetical protein